MREREIMRERCLQLGFGLSRNSSSCVSWISRAVNGHKYYFQNGSLHVNSVITNRSGPSIFVPYSRNFVISVNIYELKWPFGGPKRDIFVHYRRDFSATSIIVITEFDFVPKHVNFAIVPIRNTINLKNLMLLSFESSCTLNYGFLLLFTSFQGSSFPFERNLFIP